MQTIEESHANIQFQQETLQSDMTCLSFQDECTQERLTTIERQLDIIESVRLRGSLRIFGLEATESSEAELKSKVETEILGEVDDEERFDENALKRTRRVGTRDDENDNSRMVLAEFTNPDDKFKLFKYRD